MELLNQSPILQCSVCHNSVPELHLISHLENCSVGPIPMEEAKLICGQCPFRVAKDKLQLMVAHCSVSGHNPETVKFEWNRFLELEENRTLTILSMGVVLRNERIYSSSDHHSAIPEQETPHKDESREGTKKRRKRVKLEEKAPSSTEEEEEVERLLSVSFNLQPDLEQREQENESQSLSALASETTKQSPGLNTQCSVCENFILRGKRTWNGIRHCLTHKPAIKPYKCNDCDFRASRKDIMMNHQKKGCSSGYTIDIDEEGEKEILDRLHSSFPSINWGPKYQHSSLLDIIPK